MDPSLIFNFDLKSDLKNWRVVNDGVMGGQSESKFYLNLEGEGTFEGTVSLENNGGFCSVKYVFDSINLKRFTHICLRVKGDGKKYQCRVKSSRDDHHSYVYPFQTNTDWQIIEIPLAEMYPVFRGRKLEIPNYDDSNLEEIAFLIGNKKEEVFQLLINRIEVK
jgi:hypothetical protein